MGISDQSNQQEELEKEVQIVNHVESLTNDEKRLTEDEKSKLIEQNKRLIPEYKAKQLELNARKNWDLFYKRNETKFFKDRRWVTREFVDLISNENCSDGSEESNQKTLLEVGCGVGNLIFPLIEEQKNNYFYYACDFSPRAIQFVKKHPLYCSNRIDAFCCDITRDEIHEKIPNNCIDIVTMIFVLSAIHPDKFDKVIQNLWKVLKPGGILLFRDYGLHDMAQIRFKPGHKISNNFYMRQDGTRSYYFSKVELSEIFTRNGFRISSNTYVHRRTINQKEKIDVPRIFIQGKFEKISKDVGLD